MTRLARFVLPLGCMTAAILACSGTENPTAPVAVEASHAKAGESGTPRGEHTVHPLKRSLPLRESIVATAIIGPDGGTLAIPAAGGRVVFPAGAIARPTTITMTARAGWDVAYDFQPHLVFPVAVTIHQDLRGTAAEQTPSLMATLGGAYFEDDLDANFVDATRQTARVKELRPGKVRHMTLSFPVDHFSGYLASSGRSSRVVDDN